MMKIYWKPLAVLAVTLGLVAAVGAAQEATAPSTPDPPVEVDVDLAIDPDIVDVDGEVVQIGRGYTLPVGKRVESVVILAGTARIAGEVEQDLVVVAGTATLAGSARVGGDVVVVAGSGEVQPGTVVGGDLVAVGSGLKVPPGFTPGGDLVSVGAFPLAGKVANAAPWLTRGLALGPADSTRTPLDVGFRGRFRALVPAHQPGVRRAGARLYGNTRPEAPDHGADGISDDSSDRAGVVHSDGVGGRTGPGALPVARFSDSRPRRRRGRRSLDRKPGSARESPNDRLLAARSLGIGLAAIILVGMVPVVGLTAWALVSLMGLGAVATALVAGLRRENPLSSASPPPPPPTDESGTDTSTGGAAEPSGRDTATAASPPQGENLSSFPRATFLHRLGALLLDFLLVTVITLPFSHMHLGRSFVLLLIYRVALWSWKGTTVGGIICGLRVARMDGKPLAFTDALVRGLASILSAAAAGLGWLWILWDPERQAWHDKIAGTVVVRVPAGWPL